jgi:hypothetical protein
MKKMQPLIRVFSPFLAFGAVWLALLPFHEPVAKWCTLTVEEPLVAGSDARLVVSLHGLEAPTELSVDLHWYGKNRENRGYLAGAERVHISTAESSSRVSIPIKESDALGFVSAVIYLSPDGSWAQRTRAAHSEQIRVREVWGRRGSGRDPGPKKPVERKCLESGTGQPLSGPEPALDDRSLPTYPYYAAGLLCVLCGALSLAPRGRRLSPWCWFLFGAFMAALGLLEQTRLGFEVTGLARRLFIAQGLYYGHQAMQKLFIAGLAAAVAAFALHAGKLLPKRLPFPLTLALCGVVGAGCQKILSGISYHYFESFFHRRIPAVPGLLRALPVRMPSFVTVGTLAGLFFAVLVAFAAVLCLFARKHNFLHS